MSSFSNHLSPKSKNRIFVWLSRMLCCVSRMLSFFIIVFLVTPLESQDYIIVPIIIQQKPCPVKKHVPPTKPRVKKTMGGGFRFTTPGPKIQIHRVYPEIKLEEGDAYNKFLETLNACRSETVKYSWSRSVRKRNN